MRVLITVATRYGSTGEIARKIGDVLEGRGIDVAVIPPDDVDTVEDYDAVVLGSAVYVGHWVEPATHLVERAASQLATRPVWLFSSGPVGDPSRKMVQKMASDPVEVVGLIELTKARDHRLFAGRLDRKNLRGVQRLALAAFRWMEGDFRDWDEISSWASEIADTLLGAEVAT